MNAILQNRLTTYRRLSDRHFEQVETYRHCQQIIAENPSNDFVANVMEAIERWPNKYPTEQQVFWIEKIYAKMKAKAKKATHV